MDDYNNQNPLGNTPSAPQGFEDEATIGAFSVPRQAPVEPQPVTPVYEAPVEPQPAAPVYQAPVEPQPVAPVYQAPAEPQPVAPVYQAPVEPQLITPMHQQIPQGYIAPQVAPEKPKKSNTPIIIGAIAAILVIVLAVVLVLVLGDKDEDKGKDDSKKTEQTDDSKDKVEEDPEVVRDKGINEAVDAFVNMYILGEVDDIEDFMPSVVWDLYAEYWEVTYDEALEEAEDASGERCAAAFFDYIEDLDYTVAFSDDTDIDYIKEDLEDYYDIDPDTVEDAQEIEIEYTFETDEGTYEDCEYWYIVKIDGQWYVYNDSFYFY